VELNWPRRSVTTVLLTLQSEAAALLSTSIIDEGRAAGFRELMQGRKPVDLENMVYEITDFGAYLVERVKSVRIGALNSERFD
jgi:hypothetical protein